MTPSTNLENKTPLNTYQLVCKKVQAHSSLEPALEYNPDQMPLTNQGLLMYFSNVCISKCISLTAIVDYQNLIII